MDTWPFSRAEHAVYRAALVGLEKQLPELKTALDGRLPDDMQFIANPPQLVVTVRGVVTTIDLED